MLCVCVCMCAGQLRFKLLAVDVPSVSGGEQRIFLEGGPGLYERGGVLDVLRDPFIKVGGCVGAMRNTCAASARVKCQHRGCMASNYAGCTVQTSPQLPAA